MSWRKRRHQGLLFIGRAKVRGERERGGNKQPKRWPKAEEQREGSGEGLKRGIHQLHFLGVWTRETAKPLERHAVTWALSVEDGCGEDSLDCRRTCMSPRKGIYQCT